MSDMGACGDELNLFGSVRDDGLAPSRSRFLAARAPRRRFSAVGTYELELTASDSEFTESTRVNVTVGPAQPK